MKIIYNPILICEKRRDSHNVLWSAFRNPLRRAHKKIYSLVDTYILVTNDLSPKKNFEINES